MITSDPVIPKEWFNQKPVPMIDSFHFPGGHTPTAEEVHKYYVPLIEKMTTQA